MLTAYRVVAVRERCFYYRQAPRPILMLGPFFSSRTTSTSSLLIAGLIIAVIAVPNQMVPN